LRERRKNCLRIAKDKTGGDRRGWLADAEYFKVALDSIAAPRAHLQRSWHFQRGWKAALIKVVTTRYLRAEFPPPAVLPQEICEQILAMEPEASEERQS
jgi:hypothetical protein